MAFSPDGRQAVTGCYDGTAILWDVRTGEKRRTFVGPTRGLSSLAFSADGRQLLAGCQDRTAILWDTRTGEKLQTFAGHTDAVSTVAFARDNDQVLTGEGDGTMRLWNTATGQELAQLISFDAGKDWLVVTPDGVFDGSENARKKYMRFRDPKDPMKVVPPEQGFADYYHPNLLADILAGHAVAPPGWQHITIRFVPAAPAPAGGKPAAPANPPPPPPSAAPRPSAK